jgi:hypothetical protein
MLSHPREVATVIEHAAEHRAAIDERRARATRAPTLSSISGETNADKVSDLGSRCLG